MKFKEYLLKDIATITMGQSPKSQFYNEDGKGIEFLQGVRTFGEDFPYFDTYTTKYNRLAYRNSILFSVRAPVGRVNWATKNIAIGRGVASISVKNMVYDRYVYYYFKKMGSFYDKKATGTVFTSINKKELESLKIKVPASYDDQKRIADRLATLDRKIHLNQQLNANLLNLANTLFKHYFPDINTGTDKIGDYIKNFDKLRKPLSKKQRSEIPGKYRYIGATSVNDHIDKYNFDGIYLLLGEDGTVQDEYGFPILQYTFGKFWPNNHAHVLQGKNVSTEWLYLYFSQRNISGIVTGAVQKKVSQKNMNSLKFKLPDSQELKKFDKIIQPLFSKIRSTKLENYQLEELKRVLLTKLF